MEFDKIKILAFNEIDFKYNKLKEYTPDILSELDVTFMPMLKYKNDSDVLGLQLGVEFLSKEEKILEYGIVLTLKIPAWKEYIKGKDAPEKLKQDVVMMKLFCDIVINYLRGAMGVHSLGTPFKNIFIPFFDTEKMATTIQVVRLD